MKESRFRLGSRMEKVRKKLSCLRIMRHWNRLRREIEDAPSLPVFKTGFDGTLKNLVE